MIIRAEHNGKDAPYTIVSRALLQEHKLPYGPKCLLLLMLSYPDTWSFTEKNLAEAMGEPVVTIHTWLNILSEYGYFYENATVALNGSPLQVSWLISETPTGREV